MWIASLTRSLPRTRLKTLVHDFDSGPLRLWWGPTVEVERGDIVHYFRSIAGYELEWVERPAPPAQSETLGSVTTVRLS
jgi:hypothetical protein